MSERIKCPHARIVIKLKNLSLLMTNALAL